jgi:serine/threonine-protein kinase RsbW
MPPNEIELEVVVPTQTRYLRLIGNLAEVLVRGMEEYTGDRDLLAYHLNLVLTEAMANAIQHASGDASGEKLKVSIRIDESNLYVLVYDHGKGFNLEEICTPDFDALEECGRGIFFIRSLMDSVDYHRCAGGNVLEMRRKLTLGKVPD